MIRPVGFPGLPEGWEVSGASTSSSDGKLQLYLGRLSRTVPRHGGRSLFIIHGQGEHGGRYHHFPHWLGDAIDEVLLPDLRGHGRSEGIRGHVDRFDEYVEDLAAILERERASNPAREMHVLGHSMGGLVLLRWLRFGGPLPFQTVTLSAPLLRLAMKVPLFKHLGGLLLAHVQGSIPLRSKIDPKTLSHDVAVQRAYGEDLLNHSFATPKFYAEMLRVTEEMETWAGAVSAPVLIQIPGQDRLVDPTTTQSFAERWETKPKKILTYEDFRHEIYNELGKDRAFGDLKKWILETA